MPVPAKLLGLFLYIFGTISELKTGQEGHARKWLLYLSRG